MQEMVGIEDDRAFAMACVSLFMQVVGILQLPEFLGGSFSPFVAAHNLINAPLNAVLAGGGKSVDKGYKTKELELVEDTTTDNGGQASKPSGKKKKPKKKGKQKNA